MVEIKSIVVLTQGKFKLGSVGLINKRWSTDQRVVVEVGASDTFSVAPPSVKEGDAWPSGISHHKISLSDTGALTLDDEKIEIPYRGKNLIIQKYT